MIAYLAFGAILAIMGLACGGLPIHRVRNEALVNALFLAIFIIAWPLVIALALATIGADSKQKP